MGSEGRVDGETPAGRSEHPSTPGVMARHRPRSGNQVLPWSWLVQASRGRKLVLEVKVFGSLGFHGNNICVSLRDEHVGMPRLSKGLRAGVQGSSVYTGLVPTFIDGQWGKGVKGAACYGLRGYREL